ncbi:hypothetical protein [Xylanimonas protaetiae]|uniref:Uncharacterized protein n=1 Tax=Xylanimonas protaetiae TaxID=2509457 RepID=A0A4P6F3Y2_9MICO|nr:hypothetical protein [Xylanimonas protaetiae]QAY70036.1 hypothetical protein ET471_08300 [Xylanimonas protaetiae]
MATTTRPQHRGRHLAPMTGAQEVADQQAYTAYLNAESATARGAHHHTALHLEVRAARNAFETTFHGRMALNERARRAEQRRWQDGEAA